MSKLAIFGGTPVISPEEVDESLFHWPIVNDAMRKAQEQVLNDGNMSGTNISKEFEEKFAEWHGVKYALSHNTGTNSLLAAMYGVGLGPGDEMICTPVTYWASAAPALSLGATVVFCDVDPANACMSPESFEAHITPRTKAVMVVHYCAHPVDMDPIMAIARKHGIKVIDRSKLEITVPGNARQMERSYIRAYSANAAVIGEVVADHPGKVVMTTEIGAQALLPQPGGELLPRIC